MTLGNSNTYTGSTVINGGTLQLANANAVQQSTVALNTANGLAFSPGIGTFNLGGLSGGGSLALSDTGGGAIALQVGGNNTSNSFTGVISGGSLSSLVKVAPAR